MSRTTLPFADRSDAGRRLAAALTHYANNPAVRVLGLPRGGVPVASEIALALKAPLDVFVIRKLGVPGEPELAMGAIASGGVRVLNYDVIGRLRIAPDAVEAVALREGLELARQLRSYRPRAELLDIKGRIVILVDDGLATGATMRAAVTALRKLIPARIVVAVPVGAREICAVLNQEADEVVCLYTPHPFKAVGRWYRDFRQTTDDEVARLLNLSV